MFILSSCIFGAASLPGDLFCSDVAARSTWQTETVGAFESHKSFASAPLFSMLLDSQKLPETHLEAHSQRKKKKTPKSMAVQCFSA